MLFRLISCIIDEIVLAHQELKELEIIADLVVRYSAVALRISHLSLSQT